MMNFLFISCEYGMLNYIDCGAANRSTMLAMALTQLGHVDIISFFKEPIRSTLPNCNVIYSKYIPQEYYSIVNLIKVKINLIIRPWHPKGYFKLCKERESIVDELYKGKKYDFVVCRYIKDAVTCGIMKYADKLIIDVDDNPTVAYRNAHIGRQFRFFWGKYLALWEIKHVGVMSERLLKQIKLSFCSNISELPYKDTVFLPNVTSYDGKEPNVTFQTPMRLLFVGWLDFLPNRDGIVHFVQHIFPLIKEKIPNVELHIVGKTKDNTLQRILRSVDGVKVLGYVENIQEEYSNSRVAVIPIYMGAGSSIKFIESIMMNRPVVTTPVGARGFNSVFKDNNHYMLAKTDEEFACKVLALLDSVDKINKMANDAYLVGNAYFSQPRFFEIVMNSINAIIPR